MGFTTVPDKAAGDVFTEAMWDTYIKDNFNTGIPVVLGNTTLGANAASIDFTGIPPDWAHLLVVAYLRGDVGAVATPINVRFNSDTGNNYDRQYDLGTGSTASAGESFAQTWAQVGNCAGGNAGANLFGALTLDIPFYSQASNNKVISSSWAGKWGTSSGNMESGMMSAFWRSSAAITTVSLMPTSGNFVSGSRVTLYGMP